MNNDIKTTGDWDSDYNDQGNYCDNCHIATGNCQDCINNPGTCDFCEEAKE